MWIFPSDQVTLYLKRVILTIFKMALFYITLESGNIFWSSWCLLASFFSYLFLFNVRSVKGRLPHVLWEEQGLHWWRVAFTEHNWPHAPKRFLDPMLFHTSAIIFELVILKGSAKCLLNGKGPSLCHLSIVTSPGPWETRRAWCYQVLRSHGHSQGLCHFPLRVFPEPKDPEHTCGFPHGCWSLSIGRQNAVMPSMSTPSPSGKGVVRLTARSYNPTAWMWNLAHHPSAVWPWGRYMSSLGLSFLSCNQRMILIPVPCGRCEGTWKCLEYSRHQICYCALLIIIPAVDCLLIPSAYSS